MYEWEKESKKEFAKTAPEGVKILGMYTPSIPWNRVWVYETDSIDKLMSTWSTRPNKIRNTDMVILS